MTSVNLQLQNTDTLAECDSWVDISGCNSVGGSKISDLATPQKKHCASAVFSLDEPEAQDSIATQLGEEVLLSPKCTSQGPPATRFLASHHSAADGFNGVLDSLSLAEMNELPVVERSAIAGGPEQSPARAGGVGSAASGPATSRSKRRAAELSVIDSIFQAGVHNADTLDECDTWVDISDCT